MCVQGASWQQLLHILRPHQLDGDLGNKLLWDADVSYGKQAAGAGPGELELSPFRAGKCHRERGGDRLGVQRAGVAVQSAGAIHGQNRQLRPRQRLRLLALPFFVPRLLVFILVKHIAGHAFSVGEPRPIIGVELRVE